MSTSLKERLRTDLNQARRDRDKARTLLLSTTISEVRNREIEIGHEAGDSEVIEVIGRAIKRRKEAAEQMRSGKREDLAIREDQEAEILATYLPPPIDEAAVRQLVRDAIASGAGSMGGVMSAIMPQIKGRFDGKDANRIVREELG
jgi:hypothetical protein